MIDMQRVISYIIDVHSADSKTNGMGENSKI